MSGFDGAQARHDANTEPREYPRCAPADHNYYLPNGEENVIDGVELECNDCDSIVVVSLMEIT